MKEKYSMIKVNGLIFLFGIIFSSCSSSRFNIQKKAYSTNFSNDIYQDWYAENHTFNNNLAYFSTQNIHQKDENLILELKSETINGKAYSGAELRSKTFFKYGTFEAEIKASDALGCITAFFLYKPSALDFKEIDVEISGKYPNILTTNHWTDKRSNGADIPLNFDSTKEFHRYEITWKPHQIIWKVDGKEVRRVTKHIPQEPLQVIFNIWASNSENWAGVINNSKLPTFAQIKSFNYIPRKK